MIIGGTLITLALWMAFIWFVDPDGFASRDGGTKRRTAEATIERRGT